MPQVAFFEQLSQYFGYFPLRYDSSKGKFVPLKYLHWLLLRILIFFSLVPIINILREPRFRYFQHQDFVETYSISVVKYYRVFFMIIKLIEIKWTQRRYTKLMNNFLELVKNTKFKIYNEQKYKRINLLIIIGIVVHESIVLWSLMWALDFKGDFSYFLSYFYFNGQNAIEFLQYVYVQIFINVLMSHLNFDENNSKVKLLINVHETIQKISKSFLHVQAMGLLFHLLFIIVTFGCAIYMGVAAIMLKGNAGPKFIIYLILSGIPLLISLKICDSFDRIQEEVNLNISYSSHDFYLTYFSFKTQ